MADNTTSGNDISAIKDTICAQQNLLQKLYNELDAEREASASAAIEALSVILRLQGEKAAVKLEADQYKRLSEEKMSHAEESLAIIEDIIYQKEMEIAALDCQVQAYRYKLLSMGCVDFSNPLQENDNLGGIGRRNSGLNSFKYKNAVNERDVSCLQEMDLISKITEEKKGQEMCDRASYSDKKTDDSIDSYWEQIRKLDVRVKEISGVNYMNSLSSRRSSGNLCDLYNSANPRVEIKGSANLLKNGVGFDYPCSPSVHDVFEVPQIDRNSSSWESHAKDENETARKDVVHPEAVEEKLYGRDEPDWRKKVLKSNHCEKQLCESTSIECRLAVVQNTALNSLHDEIRHWKVKKTAKRDEPSLCALSETMLYFWL